MNNYILLLSDEPQILKIANHIVKLPHLWVGPEPQIVKEYQWHTMQTPNAVCLLGRARLDGIGKFSTDDLLKSPFSQFLSQSKIIYLTGCYIDDNDDKIVDRWHEFYSLLVTSVEEKYPQATFVTVMAPLALALGAVLPKKYRGEGCFLSSFSWVIHRYGRSTRENVSLLPGFDSPQKLWQIAEARHQGEDAHRDHDE